MSFHCLLETQIKEKEKIQYRGLKKLNIQV